LYSICDKFVGMSNPWYKCLFSLLQKHQQMNIEVKLTSSKHDYSTLSSVETHQQMLKWR